MKDPRAADCWAIKVDPSANADADALVFPMDAIEFESGAKYRLRIRVLVEKDGEGEEFRAGLVDAAGNTKGEIAIGTDVEDGEYIPHPVFEGEMAPTDRLWFRAGRPNADGKPAWRALYVDKIDIRRLK